MTRYLVMIKSNAMAGREVDYEAWYNDIHLGEVLQVPGFISGQQFRSPLGAGGEKPKYSHFALIEMETDDPQATMAHLGQVFASGGMTLTDALDTSLPPESQIFVPTGPAQAS